MLRGLIAISLLVASAAAAVDSVILIGTEGASQEHIDHAVASLYTTLGGTWSLSSSGVDGLEEA